MKGAFEDNELVRHFLRLKNIFKFNKVFETGTHQAVSAIILSGLIESVYTVEENINYYTISKEILKEYTNVRLFHGHSPDVFREVLKQGETGWCFFLDAHNGNPTFDELDVIAEKEIHKPVIMIHDFNNHNTKEAIEGFKDIMWKIYKGRYNHYVIKDNLHPQIASPTGVFHP